MTLPCRAQPWRQGEGITVPKGILPGPGNMLPPTSNGSRAHGSAAPRIVISPSTGGSPKPTSATTVQPEQVSPSRPRNDTEVLRWTGEGRLSPPEACHYFQALDQDAGDGHSLKSMAGVEASLAELDALVGLGEIKALVRELQAYVEIQRRRREQGLAAEALALHMVFKGNPGTGKTTVARILGTVFREAGVLAKGHLLEVERADLVGEYIGHTAQKTRELLKKASGGILFIDEAYALARGGARDFGKEAIDTLVKAMEDQRENLILVLAGYKDEMEWFLQQNPGLRSRFPVQMEFSDYSADELFTIGLQMFEERQYRVSHDGQRQLYRLICRIAGRPNRGNARAVRNAVEYAIRRQALRLIEGGYALTREHLMLIESGDVEGFLLP